jgi:hypothetical protein
MVSQPQQQQRPHRHSQHRRSVAWIDTAGWQHPRNQHGHRRGQHRHRAERPAPLSKLRKRATDRGPDNRGDAPHRRHQCRSPGPQRLRQGGVDHRIAQTGQQTAMSAAAQPYVMAGAALAAASLVAVTPIAPRPLQLPILSIETRLVDATDSILNVPINLLDDILNIPYNEIQGLDTLAGSLLMSGNWWVPSSTNIWGIDPGDTTHVQATADLLAPFPALDNGYGGLAYEIDGLLAAELPVSASCDAATCAPVVPPTELTGLTGIDRILEFFSTFTGQTPFPLVDNWFKVPLSELMQGYTFTSANDPGVVDPSGPAYYDPALGFSNDPSNYFLGGTGAGNTMPWDGHTFTLNLFQPLQNFWQSLLAPPSTDGIAGATGIAVPGTGIEIPTFTDIFQALQTDLAGLIVAFDPFEEGSSVCPATCDNIPGLTVQALLHDLDPNGTNPQITAYLADLANTTATNDGTTGTVNNATLDQAQQSIALLQTGMFNLSPDQLATVDTDLANINPELPALLTNAGIITDPGYLSFLNDPGSGSAFDPVYGGFNPTLILPDLWDLLVGSDAHSAAVDAASSAAVDTASQLAGSLFGL